MLPLQLSKRFLATAVAIFLLLAGLIGCNNQPSQDSGLNQSELRDPQLDTPNQQTADIPAGGANAEDFSGNSSEQLIAQINRALGAGEIDRAIQSADRALIQSPDSPEVQFAAANAYVSADRIDQGVELLKSILSKPKPIGVPTSNHSDIAGTNTLAQAAKLFSKTIFLKARSRKASDNYEEVTGALTVLRGVVNQYPSNLPLRRELWAALNRLGLREEASRMADQLCSAGLASREDLISLLQRNLCFPLAIPSNSDPEEHFERGLGMARWLHANDQLQDAIEQLRNYPRSESQQAEIALLGRLLFESQQHESFSEWILSCNTQTQQLNDFWAALGTYFLDQHEYAAATRALMEALLRDPTDERSAHRLAKSLDALGRSQDAEQARHRAVLIVQLKQEASSLQLSGNSAAPAIVDQLLELGRPFEALNWKIQGATKTQINLITAYREQLRQLCQNPDAISMAFEMSQLDLDREQFKIPKELLQSYTQKDTNTNSQPQTAVGKMRGPVSSQYEDAIALHLVDQAEESGIDFQWFTDIETNLAEIPLHEVMGGGAAAIDYQLDGWPDIYLAQGSGEPPTNRSTRSNQLFSNISGSFRSITTESQTSDYHYSSGIASGDVNQDGFPDLWIGNLGPNRLLINNGDGTFHDESQSLGASDDRFTSSVAIADLNGDHLPDLFEVAYVEMDGAFRLPEVGSDGKAIVPSPLSFYAASDRWYENLGNGKWREHLIAGDGIEPGTGLGLLISDLDDDGQNEVFVANDGRANHYLKIQPNGEFTNLADLSGLAAGFDGGFSACMGVAAADFDHNGLIDLHISNFSQQANHHYLQLSDHLFTDLAIKYQHANWSSPYVGFGLKATDLDRNGWIDLVATNGHIFDLRDRGEALQMPAQVILNRDGRFETAQTESWSEYWQKSHVGRSITKIDFNQDQRIDFIITHLDDPLALLTNQTDASGNWLQLELIGTASERDAVGAKVVLTVGSKQWCEWVTAGDGYLSSDQKLLDFGLGPTSIIDQVEIHWPSGTTQRFNAVETNQRLLVVEEQASPIIRQSVSH